MYYIYILYSASSDIFYVGYSSDYTRRLQEHNTQANFNTFTSKHRPWVLRAVFKCGEDEKTAVGLERFIKNQKSRKLLQQLCNAQFIPTGKLSRLVRVPDVRD